jgi:hypothetical protein
MKRWFLYFPLIVLAACSQTGNNTASHKDTTTVVSYDTIPEIRQSVRTAPAATYSEPIEDELNDWKFAVSLYETKRTFHYALRIQCKEIRVSDSITIPNFGVRPRVQIEKGKEPLTCIIGFLNQKNEFMKYRQVSFKNDRLRVTNLASYSVGAYKTKVSR